MVIWIVSDLIAFDRRVRIEPIAQDSNNTCSRSILQGYF